MPPKKAKSGPKQPAIYRQKRQNGQDTAFTIIDGKRIHLGIFGTPEAETEYRRLVAEWNANIVAPKQINSADITVAELVLRFLKERERKKNRGPPLEHIQNCCGRPSVIPAPPSSRRKPGTRERRHARRSAGFRRAPE